tara:strand:+ start:344 stop:628 length:285 start_codon:yes stop_codon:yes gene_type:complete
MAPNLHGVLVLDKSIESIKSTRPRARTTKQRRITNHASSPRCAAPRRRRMRRRKKSRLSLSLSSSSYDELFNVMMMCEEQREEIPLLSPRERKK